MSSYTSPKRALFLLDELQALGFTDKAFGVLHHFGPKERIQSFRNYCETRPKAFQAGGTNAAVVQRLEMVLRMYWAAGLMSSHEDLFVHLAHATMVEVPLQSVLPIDHSE
ncbi:hypothetical protein [Hydrogenophaga sp. IBVHS2]|uniref:hypothetical protein n=1 Tax=Hydrogenophaga sp. IBVHS2 TaxID=1985170 RepID=UPI00117A463D|nr:hypothetical protein [Hydrogenophaga sp. IBVHS2]